MLLQILCLVIISRGETHVPIPNTLVKPPAADGSAVYCGVRVGRRQAFFFSNLTGLSLLIPELLLQKIYKTFVRSQTELHNMYNPRSLYVFSLTFPFTSNVAKGTISLMMTFSYDTTSQEIKECYAL